MGGGFGKYGDAKRKAQISRNCIEKKAEPQKLRLFCTKVPVVG